MEQLMKIDISKLAEEYGKGLEIYWDYRDELSEEQILKILTKEDGLMEIEDEICENNWEYMSQIAREQVEEKIKENNLELTEEQRDELITEVEGYVDCGLNSLIKKSSIKLRVTLQSNEDAVPIVEDCWKDSNTIKEFKRRFKGHFKVKDLVREIQNTTCDYAQITFYFKVSGNDILALREQILKGELNLKKGLEFGMFNSWTGSGGMLDIELLKPITLNLRDWRTRNLGEEVVNALDGNPKSYYSVSIQSDKISKYGIDEVYGLSGWQEW